MKLLVVDDSKVMRNMIGAVASVLRLETVDAEDGVDALTKMSANYGDIGLVLLDWNMPGKSGYDVLVEIKTNELYRHIPVMMVTTEGQKRNIIAAVRAGADNYLTKPFTPDLLESKILECLQND